MPNYPLFDLSKPPICLHILGQGLVNQLWREGQELKKELADAKISLAHVQAEYKKFYTRAMIAEKLSAERLGRISELRECLASLRKPFNP